MPASSAEEEEDELKKTCFNFKNQEDPFPSFYFSGAGGLL